MRTRLLALLLIALALSTVSVMAADAPAPDRSPRQADVRAKGKDVMPFSLDKTVHSFDKTANGGVQRVRVRGEAPEQVAMIRSHLRQIAAAFTARNFDKPAHIHGADMPGLAAMKAARPGELGVNYRELEDGAQITYAGRTSPMVAAVHAWFDAQLSDHGRDAVTSTMTSLDALAWLGGSWIIDDGKQHIEEQWSAPANDLMIGMSRTVRDGKTQSFEFMRIEARSDGVFYIAQPSGKPPVEFPLQSWDGTQAVFVNPGNADHLQRIVYRRNADGTLTARIEGENAGAAFTEDYPYRRPQAVPAG